MKTSSNGGIGAVGSLLLLAFIVSPSPALASQGCSALPTGDSTPAIVTEAARRMAIAYTVNQQLNLDPGNRLLIALERMSRDYPYTVLKAFCEADVDPVQALRLARSLKR